VFGRLEGSTSRRSAIWTKYNATANSSRERRPLPSKSDRCLRKLLSDKFDRGALLD
jgi:hypothetical protein